MTIDKDYPGLRISKISAEPIGYYKLFNDIETSENLLIKVPLYIRGSIKAKEWIKCLDVINCRDSIKSGEWIHANKSISVADSISAISLISAGWWIKAGKLIEAGKTIKVGWWIEAGESIKLCGVKTKTLYCVNGSIIYNIWIMDNHIKIGQNLKTKDEWLKITEKELNEIDYHGTMATNINFIHALCNYRTKENNQ